MERRPRPKIFILLDGVPAQGFGAGLVSLWDDFGGWLPAGERLPSDGLDADLIMLGPHWMPVVVLPRPSAPAEAYYTAVVQPDGADHCRYFTLEHAVNPFTGEPYTVLGEWADGRHLNLGSHPAPELAAFLTAVVALLAESAPVDAVSHLAPADPQGKPERRGLRRLFGR